MPGIPSVVFMYSQDQKVNARTPEKKCSVKYKDLDNAIKMCLDAGQGCYMAKSDMKSAFRNLPIKPQDRKWLVLMAIHPITGRKWYFIEKCLSFGYTILCALFREVSDAIEHIFFYRTGYHSNNYLDDFFFIAFLEMLCNDLVNQFLQICEEINFPVAIEKAYWATPIIVFLGMLLNTITQQVFISEDKVQKALNLLDQLWPVEKKKATVLQIQQTTHRILKPHLACSGT